MEKILSEVQRYDTYGVPVILEKKNDGEWVRYDDYAALAVDRDQLKANYENACKMIADMHAAAMGKVCGPELGVVEDIAARLQVSEATVAKLRGRRANLLDYLSEAQRDNGTLEQSNARLTTALEALVKQLQAVHADPRYISVWTLFQIHGGRYDGPNYSKEFEAAHAALEPPDV